MEKDEINIPPIVLEWSPWVAWNDLKIDVRYGEGVRVPTQSGVYEVKYKDDEQRLTIGKATDLRYRIKQGLVRGKAQHSSGEKIREKEDVSNIVVRWAVTDRPAAVEEDLHKRYQTRTGALPKYTDHT